MNHISYPLRRSVLSRVAQGSAQLIGSLLLLSYCTWAQAQNYQSDPHEEVRKLLRRAKYDQALILVKKYVAVNPRDPQMRFWEAYIYEQMNQPALAKPIYLGLTQEHPELAEPHNNLGVLLAADGNYGEARQMFELALRANPRYAVAQENLGDVLLQLARQAYTRALEIDATQRSAAKKIDLLQPITALSEKKP